MPSQFTNGRWIIGDLGQKKMQEIADVLFLKCHQRIQTRSTSKIPFQVWMTSPEMSQLYIESPQLFSVIEASGVLDFSKNYLTSVRTAIELKEYSKHRDEHGLTINVDILQNDPSSLPFFSQAYELTNCWSAWQRNLFYSVVKSVVPISDQFDSLKTGNAFSDRHFIGTLFTSIKRTNQFPEIDLNISLAHELGHQALMIYQYSNDLLIDFKAPTYSAIRKTLRPAIASFHAVVALSHMLSAVNSLLESNLDTERKTYLRNLQKEYASSFDSGLNALKSIQTTELADLILNDLLDLRQYVKRRWKTRILSSGHGDRNSSFVFYTALDTIPETEFWPV